MVLQGVAWASVTTPRYAGHAPELHKHPADLRTPQGCVSNDRGVRAACRPRRLPPRADRRRDRRMTSRLPGGKVDVLAGRDRGQRREPARVGVADIKPAELDALDQG